MAANEELGRFDHLNEPVGTSVSMWEREGKIVSTNEQASEHTRKIGSTCLHKWHHVMHDLALDHDVKVIACSASHPGK